jgi:glycerate kinase
MKKTVIAIDSFKGSLTSDEAGQAVAKGIKDVYPTCEIIQFPIADGGEGMLEVIMSATNGEYVYTEAHDPLMNVIKTRYAVSGDKTTALIEMASISGLPLVPEGKRNPMLTTTYGMGELIESALDKGFRNFIIGIGGSATNDAGLGMLQALGYRFLDKSGNELGYGGQVMEKVATIDDSSVHQALRESHFTVACDVHNPFYGENGAAYVYARQKGADDAMIRELDKGLHSLASVVKSQLKKDIADCPGAGAAGGMGGGILGFLNAELKPGIKLLLDALHFAEKIQGADLIITGEGKVDRQTIMGKVSSGILEEAQKQHIPVIVIAGGIENVEEMNKAGFGGVFSITPSPISLEEATEPAFAAKNIERLVTQLCRTIDIFNTKRS